MMPWLVPAAVLIDLIGYFVPLGLYLDDLPGPQLARPDPYNVSLPVDAEAFQLMKLSLVDQGAWFTNNAMTFTLLTSLASVTFGVGAIAISLFLPVGIIFYLFFERKRFRHQYEIEPSLVLQSLIVYAICAILTFCISGSTRQQFILRIYVQHERDLRVEQLEREKERLDYERVFALRNISTTDAPGDNLGSGHEHDREDDGRVAACSEPGGGSALDQVCRVRTRLEGFGSSAASTISGVSEPELALGAAAATSSTKPRVATGCSARATQLMQSHDLPPRLGYARECSRPGDETESHQTAPSSGIGIHLEGFTSSSASSSGASEPIQTA